MTQQPIKSKEEILFNDKMGGGIKTFSPKTLNHIYWAMENYAACKQYVCNVFVKASERLPENSDDYSSYFCRNLKDGHKRLLSYSKKSRHSFLKTHPEQWEWLDETPCEVGEENRRLREARPKIVCLCGSTRFHHEFTVANFNETMNGNIVLSVAFYPNKQEHGQRVGITGEEKIMLDELYKRKIDLADEIFVIDVDGYIGSSTRSEIDYAIAHNKPVRYLTAGLVSDAGNKEE